MTSKNDTLKKSWVAPRLRKTSIEQITATGLPSPFNDGGTGTYSHDS